MKDNNYLPYGISTSDGHGEEWEYFPTEAEAKKRFEALKHHESDIHLYEYNKDLGYEVIDSFWLGDYECPSCESDEVYYQGETMMCGDCHHKEETQYFEKS
jgi:hypothetical protein